MRSLILSLAITAVFAAASAADTVKVTNTADSGPGSLRAAIEAVNAGQCREVCFVAFNIAEPVPAAGWFTIRPQSPLPYVRARYIYIDGNAQTAFTGDTNPHGPEVEIDGSDAGLAPGLKLVDVVSGGVMGLSIHSFGGNGIVFERGSTLEAHSNYLGVDPTGTAARPNGMNGILVAGTDGPSIISNVIGGNSGNGIFIFNSNARIYYNRVGMGRSPAFVLGNGANGIEVHGRPAFVSYNQVAFNGDHGIVVDGLVVRLEGNSIWANRYLSIDLGNDGADANDVNDEDRGPNGRQNKPVVTFARTELKDPSSTVGDVVVRGTIHSRPHHGVTIEVFASPHRNDLGLPEARVFLGHTYVSTGADGNAIWEVHSPQSGQDSLPLLVPGGYIAATATAAEGTSELSDAIPLQVESQFVITTTADEGPGSLRAAIDGVNRGPCIEARPCWIAFHVPNEQLQPDGVARFELLSPLPAITATAVYVDGASQTYWSGERVDGPEVELSGVRAGAGAVGLQFGTATAPVRLGMLRGIAVRGFDGDGGIVHFSDARVLMVRNVSIVDVSASHNGGAGLRVFGGERNPDYWVNAVHQIVRLTATDNRGDGLVIHGHRIATGASTFAHNGAAGVLVHGELNAIGSSSARDNGGPGFASSVDGRALLIEASVTSGNRGLGIDRNNDGVTTADPRITDAPTLLSVRYDAESGNTIVRGVAPAGRADVLLPQSFSHVEHYVRLWASRTPDPSGFGEGESAADTREHQVIKPNGTEEWEVRIPRDLRGQYLSGTRVLAFCYWEFGCKGRDTSEYGNALKVE